MAGRPAMVPTTCRVTARARAARGSGLLDHRVATLRCGDLSSAHIQRIALVVIDGTRRTSWGRGVAPIMEGVL